LGMVTLQASSKPQTSGVSNTWRGNLSAGINCLVGPGGSRTSTVTEAMNFCFSASGRRKKKK
jgi:chromosome segregation ATPase